MAHHTCTFTVVKSVVHVSQGGGTHSSTEIIYIMIVIFSGEQKLNFKLYKCLSL